MGLSGGAEASGLPGGEHTAAAAPGAWRIVGARHAGITVSDPDGCVIEFHKRPPRLAHLT